MSRLLQKNAKVPPLSSAADEGVRRAASPFMRPIEKESHMETTSTQSYPISKSARRVVLSANRGARLSEQVIPAVRGEFYSYTSDFSKDRPLYFLMKCRANKCRSLTTDVKHIVQELDLTFVFGNEVILCSPNSAPSVELLRNVMVAPEELNHSEIRAATVTEDIFYDCYYEKKESFLVDIHRTSGVSESSVVLSSGLILSIKTDSGKYGLILVRELTPFTCEIDACHILL